MARPTRFSASLLAFFVFLVLLAGCSSSNTQSSSAPSGLTYSQSSLTVTAGQAVTLNVATVSGTQATYSVSPSLPAGLSLNSSTGSITGTATAASAQTTYTITATNSAGSTSCSLQITVSAAVTAPTQLMYPTTSIAAAVGQAITPDVPTISGSAAVFSVSPSLPAGLTLNTSTGAISGTATAVSTQATYTITATNSAGSTSATVQITVSAAPSQLVYPVTSLTAAVGLAITPDVPTVSGTAPTFTVAPALPAGLTLNASTGAISGTPTAAAAQASYVVTATNTLGTTSATLQISVVTALTGFSYPVGSITSMVGDVITPLIPSVTGSVTSFSVTPALPAGLTFDTTTGMITGSSTASQSSTTYSVTATNGYNSLTVTLGILVSKKLDSLLDVGMTSTGAMQATTTRLLTQSAVSGTSAHWVLWDRSSQTNLASGDQGVLLGDLTPPPAYLANTTVAIGIPNGVELLSATDGHLQAVIAHPSLNPSRRITKTWWLLASDGSYICSGATDGLRAWDTTGHQIVSKSGDYSTAFGFAAAGEIRVGNGPAGTNKIETISLAGGSTLSAAYSGTFSSWFPDGTKFLTNTGTTVWTYSKDASQLALVVLPTVDGLAGVGNWIWTKPVSTYPTYTFSIYPIGSNTPTATYTFSTSISAVGSGVTIGILPSGTATVSVIDLSGAAPVKQDYTLPIAYETAFTATSGSDWIVGNQHGAVVDGPSSQTTPKYYGLGKAWSISGSSSNIAISTATGTILYLDPVTKVVKQTIGFPSSKAYLSADGTILTALSDVLDTPYTGNPSIHLYSMPAGTLTGSRSYSLQTSYAIDFSMPSSGTVLAELDRISGTTTFARSVSKLDGTSIYSDTTTDQSAAVLLSPDGTLIAVPFNLYSSTPTARIYKNGTLVTAVSGTPVGWVDNNRLLVSTFVNVKGSGVYQYQSARLVDATGAELGGLSVPSLQTIQPTSRAAIYSLDQNTVYSLSDGSALWSTLLPGSGIGAVTDNRVVFLTGSRILIDSY